MQKILLTVPVYNEEKALEENIKKIIDFAKNKIGYPYTIVIADNASTDRTRQIGQNLSKQFEEIDYFFIPQKGRGFALREAWTRYKADVYAYMDIDLSSDIAALPEIIDLILKGSDIVIGTRLAKESKVLRRLDREILSRGYNLVLKIIFNNKFSDAQCGFKAFSKKTVKKLMPHVKDNRWFFDTEFLIKAEHMGYQIKEVPLSWVESRNTKVKIYSTIFYFVINMFRLKKELIHLHPSVKH